MSERGEATYIGDGVYAAQCPVDPNAFEIFTFDGVYKKDSIYIDQDTFQSLLAWIGRTWKVKLEVKSDAAGRPETEG